MRGPPVKANKTFRFVQYTDDDACCPGILALDMGWKGELN